MTEHYGVICQNPKCKTAISLETIEPVGPTQVQWFTVPSTAIKCGKCGHSGLYGPADGFQFVTEDPTPTDKAL